MLVVCFVNQTILAFFLSMPNNIQLRVKLCGVCGSTASGFHFGSVSCEKCRIFFKRNYNKLKVLTCLQKENNCPIDNNTRKWCSDSNYTETPINKKLKCARKQHQKPKCFTVHEQQVVTELQNALSTAFEDETKLELVGTVTEITNALNLTTMYARRIIKFCKSMPPFKALNSADQLAILKNFYLKILMLRIAFMWDTEKQGYPVIEDESGTKALFLDMSLHQKLKNQDIIQYKIRQTERMHDTMEDDQTIRDLLIAQALFCPISTLSSVELVWYHYTVFYQILFKYLHIKYNGNKKQTQKKFFALQSLLKEFETIMNKSEQLYKAEFKNTEKANEIIGEIFNSL